jgi:biotin carboxyl carrier protein
VKHLPRKFRVETLTGEILIVEVEEGEKDKLKVRIAPGKETYNVRLIRIDDDQALFELNGELYRIGLHGEGILVNDENSLVERISELPPIGLASPQAVQAVKKTLRKPGEIRAPLSGKINDVKVKVGDHVSVGEVVILMESMKMITEVKSDVEGIVEEIYVKPGDAVNKDTLLLKIKPIGEKKSK